MSGLRNTNLLQCVAVCCSVLQCVAVCCTVCCNMLQCKVWNFSFEYEFVTEYQSVVETQVLQCVAMCCSVL